MNGYYTGNSQYKKEAAPYFARPASGRLERFLDFIFLIMTLAAKALRDRSVRRVLRYSLVAVCAVAFIGLIGGVEQELISMGSAIFAGLFLVFVEILCLR